MVVLLPGSPKSSLKLLKLCQSEVLVTTLTKVLLVGLLSLARRTTLGGVLVVSNFYHFTPPLPKRK